MKIVFRLMSVVFVLVFLSVSCERKKEPVPDVPLGQDTTRPEQRQAQQSQDVRPTDTVGEKAADNNHAPALPDKNAALPENPQAEKSPHGAKKTGEKQKHQVVVSEEVKNRWEAVRLAITDKQTKKTETAVVALGGTYQIPGSEFKIKAGDFIPDFKVDALSVTSASNTPNNPAVSITISQDGKEIFDGWLFEKYPEVHAFEHPRYAVILKEGVEKGSKKGK